MRVGTARRAMSAEGGVDTRLGHDDDSSGLRVAAPYDPDPVAAGDGGTLDARAFHNELRKRNLPILFWAAVVFNTAYIVWTVFDYVLVPEHWWTFFLLRVTAVAINTVMVVIVLRPRFNRLTLEGIWFQVFIWCAFIAPMLPLAGENLSKYVMGLSVTMVGAGVVPVWHPRWPITLLLSAFAINAGFFFAGWTGDIQIRDVVAGGFVVMTAVGLSVLAAYFKYDLARRDFRSRVQLSTVARRESEARMVLAKTSEDLQDALEKLKELDRLKSRFFANISHELRTPLTLVLAPLSELDASVKSPAARQQVRVIRRNAERLLGLINDMLDLSRLDAGGLRLNLAEMDIRSVATSVHENSTPAAMADGIDLVIASNAPTRLIWGDAHRLEIVMTNLVSNALKFTPRGGRVEIRVDDEEEGVRIVVEDTGVGLRKEDLDQVFERFFQVSPTDRRREGGVGIGLALAKELVELHGGNIEVSSDGIDKGTAFFVLLPFGRDHIKPEVIERRQQFEESSARRRSEDQSEPTADSLVAPSLPGEEVLADLDVDEVESDDPGGADVPFAAGRKPRILLAEDNSEVRDFIRSLLEPRFEVELAEDGAAAWAAVREHAPDLIVSDVMMPGMSGTELCQGVKNDPVLRSIPVILLTAKVGSEATLEAYSHGADDFVAKPFHPRVLMARIRAQLNLRAMALHLAMQEKMAVVGTMSAGILHEVRNPVNAILNASRALTTNELDGDIRRQLLEVIADAAVRIDEITSALDTHARPAEAGVTGACDLQAGMEATLRLLRYRLDSVEVHRDFAADHLARAQAGPVNQVLLNLVDNALRIGADNLWLSIRQVEEILVVTVGDDGPGVPEEDLERVFDPFFTNRPDGGGTGLGLYLSRRMIEEAEGTLTVENREGGGAVFTMTVPALPLGTASEARPGSG